MSTDLDWDVNVTARVELNPDDAPIVKGSAAWPRPTHATWRATRYMWKGDRPLVVTVIVEGWQRDHDVRARGCALFEIGGGEGRNGGWAAEPPAWIPRPPVGWLNSMGIAS